MADLSATPSSNPTNNRASKQISPGINNIDHKQISLINKRYRSTLHNYHFAFLNCYNKIDAYYEVRQKMVNNNWLVGLNEYNHKLIPIASLSNDIFTNGRSAIITPKGKWMQSITPHNTEIITAKSSICNRNVMVIVIYFSPTTRTPRLKELSRTIHNIIYQNKSTHYIVMGDVNKESRLWSTKIEKGDGDISCLERVFIHCGLQTVFDPYLHPPTRITDTSCRSIDIAMISNKLTSLITNEKIIPSIHSDHSMLHFSLKNTPIWTQHTSLQHNKYSNVIKQIDFTFLNQQPTTTAQADMQASLLQKLVHDAVKKCTLTKSTRISNISKKSICLIRRIKRRKRTLIKNVKNDDQRKIIKNESKRLIKYIRKQEFNSTINIKQRKYIMLQNKNKTWILINKVMGKKIRHITNSDSTCIKDETKFIQNINDLTKDYTDKPFPNRPSKLIAPLIDTKLSLSKFQSLTRNCLKKTCYFDSWLNSLTVKPLFQHHGTIYIPLFFCSLLFFHFT